MSLQDQSATARQGRIVSLRAALARSSTSSLPAEAGGTTSPTCRRGHPLMMVLFPDDGTIRCRVCDMEVLIQSRLEYEEANDRFQLVLFTLRESESVLHDVLHSSTFDMDAYHVSLAWFLRLHATYHFVRASLRPTVFALRSLTRLHIRRWGADRDLREVGFSDEIAKSHPYYWTT